MVSTVGPAARTCWRAASSLVISSASPWLKFEVLNLFNNQTLGAGIDGFNTTITPDASSSLDRLGLPTGFLRDAKFGQALSADSYPVPRAWDVAFGIRF